MRIPPPFVLSFVYDIKNIIYGLVMQKYKIYSSLQNCIKYNQTKIKYYKKDLFILLSK